MTIMDAPPPSKRESAPFSVTPLAGMPLFSEGMSVAGEIVAAARRREIELDAGDIVVIAQKIVSKAEGRILKLGNVAISAEARALAERSGKPAALAQLILDESTEILRATRAAIITRHKSGHVTANAGIDASNVEGGSEDSVLLWPRDPDASARAIRGELSGLVGAAPAVLIADSLGRAWRMGTVGTAIGSAGLVVVDDRRGEIDLYGRTLQATLVGVADSVAAAAVLAKGEGAEGAPAAVVRGLARYVEAGDSSGAASAVRPLHEDLFR
jgi:coenzyme F420-0:L-glutamate ligase/coenzyme F420-1:gamma-L-glutamate ligase